MTRLIQRFETDPRPVVDVFWQASRAASAALERLVGWGVRLPPDSRLEAAILQLEDCARAGGVPRDGAQREIALNALLTALDYSDISRFLPANRVAAVRRDLEQSLQGSLEDPQREQPWLQLQAQLWVGAVLCLGGLEAKPIPPRGRVAERSPDFIIENGTAAYGVEVKRLSSIRSLAARLADAADQLRDQQLTGAVVIDVSECLRGIDPEEFEATAMRIGEEAFATIWHGPHIGYRPGFSPIMVTSVVARTVFEASADANELSITHIATDMLFAHSRKSLLGLHGEWLRQGIQSGFKKAGWTEMVPDEPAPTPLPPAGAADKDRDSRMRRV